MLIPYAYATTVEGKCFFTTLPRERDKWIEQGLTVTSLYTLPQMNAAVRAVFETPRVPIPA